MVGSSHSGLSYIHSNRLMHRDLKPQNLLISQEGILKIADFGLSRSQTLPPRDLTHDIITLWYRPPEVLLGHREYLPSVDMWSFGTILCRLALQPDEMISNLPLFPGESEIDQLFKIFQTLGTPDPLQYPEVASMPHFKKR